MSVTAASRPRRIRRAVLGTLCVAAVLTLPACGPLGQDSKDPKTTGKTTGKGGEEKKAAPFADLSGPEIAEKASKATRGASSLTLKADLQDTEEGHIVFDMALSTKGDCTGTMSMNDEGNVIITKVGKTVYMQYDEEFLRAQAKGEPKAETDAVVKMLAGRWVKTDATSPDAKDFVTFCDLDELLSAYEGGSVARKGPLGTVNNQPTIALTETDGKDSYTMHVATEGEPYLLKVVSTGTDPGTMIFSDFNKPVPAKVPADKDILDLDNLNG
ncbi:hypothetical protein ACFVWX_19005 [Streptomyces sp. NPDC058220]|uniref:hypothetical protein n=1 Tax=unclassified Streptomyces TaxID=2593676 RepID=UPI003646BEBE